MLSDTFTFSLCKARVQKSVLHSHSCVDVQVRFPSRMSQEARELLSGLLIKDPKERLGGGPEDALEIINHAFFKNINWQDLEAKKVRRRNRSYRHEMQKPRPIFAHHVSLLPLAVGAIFFMSEIKLTLQQLGRFSILL